MSQEAAPKAHHGKLETDAMAHSDPADNPEAAQSNARPKPSAQEAQAPQQPSDVQQPAKAEAATDEYLELDDDELLELACASMDPPEHGISSCQDVARPQAPAAAATSGSKANHDSQPATSSQAEGSCAFCV